MKFKSYYWAIFAAVGVVILVLVVPFVMSRSGGNEESASTENPHSQAELESFQMQAQAALDLSPQIELYQSLINANPSDPVPVDGLGKLYISTGKYPEAMELFKKAVALDPGNAIYHTSLGVAQIYANNNRVEAGLAEIQKGLELDPNNQDIIFTLGAAYANINRLAEAKQLWQKAVSLDPTTRLGQMSQAALDELENPGSSTTAGASGQ